MSSYDRIYTLLIEQVPGKQEQKGTAKLRSIPQRRIFDAPTSIGGRDRTTPTPQNPTQKSQQLADIDINDPEYLCQIHEQSHIQQNL